MASASKVLTKLEIFFCQHSGSSAGVRSCIEQSLSTFQQAKPAVEVETIKRSGHHPFVKATFANGISYEWGLRNHSSAEVTSVLHRLANRLGRPNMGTLRAIAEVRSATPSIQGRWRPGLFAPPLVFVNRRGSDQADLFAARQSALAALGAHPQAAHVREAMQAALASKTPLGKKLVPVIGGAKVQGTNAAELLKQLKQHQKQL